MHMILAGLCASFHLTQAKAVVEAGHSNTAIVEDACSPVSTLPCSAIKVTLPFTLSFNAGVAGSILDKAGVGTGFTTVNTYSGTRAASDGAVVNSLVPGYVPSKISVTGGSLVLTACKGIDSQTNNNMLNVLGAKVASVKKMQLDVTIINPLNAASSQQAGLWYGINDKTFIKLVVSANKVELRKEKNDVTSSVTSNNPDQRITATISNLNTQTVRLRMVIDSAANTVEGLYSTDGINYISTGATYSIPTLDITGLGVTGNEVYAGISGTYRNSSTANTYTFDDFSIKDLNAVAPVFQAINVNFRPTGTAAPAGYLADNGLAFDATRKYGWISPTTKLPIDLKANMRLRTGSTDAKQLSLVQMQATTDNQKEGVWEYALPAGLYTVTVSAGDNNFYDSNHRINVEGLPTVSDYVSSAQNKFRVATATVQVNDGKLTIDATGGVNTKMNYVIINQASTVADAVAPTASARITGTLLSPNVYEDQAQIYLTATDTGGSGLSKLQYSINNGAYINYSLPISIITSGNYSLKVKAVDANNNETITSDYNFGVIVKPATGVYMVLKNMDNFPANDQLVFSYINIPWRRTSPDTTVYNSNHDRVKLRIYSKGTGKLTINSMGLSNSSAWKIASINADTTSALPILINPGAYAEVTVQFMARDLMPRVQLFADTLTITSNDSLAPLKKVMLRGIWQKRGEGNYEPYAQEIINGSGFKSQTGYTNNDAGINGKTIVPNSSEIAASYFVKADNSKPVTVYQVAAYHGCCAATESIRFFPKGSTTLTTIFTHTNLDGQSMLPRLRTPITSPAQGSFESAVPFGFTIGTANTDRTKNYNKLIGIRILKAYDSDGNIIPNAYFFNGDYLGTAYTNFDYQDNIYYVENIKPETGSVGYSDLASVNASAVNFNTIQAGATTPVTLTLKNMGIAYSGTPSDPAITLISAQISGVNASEFTVGSLATTNMAVQGTTPLTVTFKPNSVGIKNAVLLVKYNNAASPLRIPLYGIANSSSASVSVAKRIKSGVNTNMTIGNNVYENDQNYRKGSVKLDVQVGLTDVRSTDIDSLYQSYLSSAADLAETSYEIPLSNGNYAVRMHFIENYWTAEGLRIFSVTAENNKVLSNLDIFREVGYRTALVKDFNVTISDGVLNMKFNPTANRLAIAGLEIYKITNNNTRVATADSVVETAPKKILITSEDKILEKGLSVYPNPNTGSQIYLNATNFGKNEKVNVSIINLSGQVIQTQTFVTDQSGSAILPVNAGNKLHKGMYIISAQSATGILRSKLLIE
ncbi:malectin domain-containing carbohydrate-binding protein [Dyadobacter sp. NIV53]|uniref:malectin domain-containing carbohydrate-binding protein n=1 Tax=Dyadobacter sp. NIV53 TaxID=2861765 RepID=UPI001C87AF9A|nr:malectin domain-containing carbohydrate-binding protein [Dyadobacter sp. NIV53]